MERTYLFTMSLLIIHQIDAAFWKEWEMFYLPGGIQGYLLFNMIAVPILLIGYKNQLNRSSNAKRYAYFCAGLGLLTFAIHTTFLVLGHSQFRLPLSLTIIVLCLLSSLWQIKQTASAYNDKR